MTPRLHPLLRLVICLFGIGALFVIITAVIVGALHTTTAISGQTIDLADFFTDHPLVATVLFYPPLLLWLWFCRRAIDGHSFRSLGLRLGGSLAWFHVWCGVRCPGNYAVIRRSVVNRKCAHQRPFA
jgi:hypothetical protein